jgi:hypothetical protein
MAVPVYGTRSLDRYGPLGRPDDELNLDAVPDDAGERLRDERAVARLEPVFGKAVRHRDAEMAVLDVDECSVPEPRLEIRG